MPTPWKRSPEELHKTYIANTEAFYKVAGRGLAQELDDFVTTCALQLWKNSRNLGQQHVEAANSLYSKGRPQPRWLLWELTDKVCASGEFLPPLFFWNLTEMDARRGTGNSRIFVRMLTNILLYLAAVDDEVTMSEADFITECSDKLAAICDGAGVPRSKAPINASEFVTSAEPAFTAKAGVSSSGGSTEAKPAQTEEPEEKPNLEELMAELDELVGLKTVKKEVKSLTNLIKVRKLREEAGLPNTAMSLHMVFLGNPGTGKTTVARLMAGLYAAIGALSKGQLVEVDRSGLVAGYVGQTALKTQEVIQSAMGGVLFIDEAYSLSKGGENDFGREAIETILKAMEDHRDDLVVIVAGYDEPMEEFINSNPGLQSRFNKYLFFPDYNGDELMAMFRSRCKKNGYVLEEDADAFALELFTDMYENRDDNFGNGRDVRNRFEDVVSRQADRLAAMENPSKDDLMAIRLEDILPAEEMEEYLAEHPGSVAARKSAAEEEAAPAEEAPAPEAGDE
ncbi:MAG: AAA family ATPase [Oscillospiraceae bacterium]|nr:AAA family ATPase [Oscillospiraceae bacterium]